MRRIRGSTGNSSRTREGAARSRPTADFAGRDNFDRLAGLFGNPLEIMAVMVHEMIMNRRSWVSMASLLAALTVTSATAFAAPSPKDRQEAAQLIAEAKKLATSGDLKQAVKKLKKADGLVPQVATKLEMGKLLADLGDLVKANTVLKEAVEAQATVFLEKRAQADAKKLLEEVERRTPRLEIEVVKPDASKVTLTVDDEETETGQPQAVNPGKHEIVAKAQGYQTWTKSVRLDEGANKSVSITMKRDDGSDDSEGGSSKSGSVPKWAAGAAWGFTAVSLGVGIGFGVMAIQTTNQVLNDYGCQNGKCPPDAEQDLKTAKLNGNVSTAFFVVSGVGAVGASVLTYFAFRKSNKSVDEADKKSDEARVLPAIGPGYVGMTGSF
jgi:hypothetical protein